jgi:topoisomerase-4 subunit A
MGLRELLRAWLDHRHEVLLRRTNHRLEAIARRLEILEGYLAVFLNLDEVIRIIRNEDEPKPALVQAFSLSEAQAEAILNMRLRSLRRLEETEIRQEHKKLAAEQKGLQALLKDAGKRWEKIETEILEVKTKFGAGPLGARRTIISTAAAVVEIAAEAFVEREPVTVILSEKGWIRAQKGHLEAEAVQKFKEGDRLAILRRCESTDKLALLATNGRVYTLKVSDLPRGRGDGQAIRLLFDLANEDGVVDLFLPDPAAKYLIAASAGRGFVIPGEELASERKAGKQILNLKPGEELAACVAAKGDHVAVIGQNRKLLVFPLSEVPEMVKGAGVALQKYKDGGMADVKVFTLAQGLSWRLGDKTRTETKLTDWLGSRAQAGRLPPNGFPKSGKFGD